LTERELIAIAHELQILENGCHEVSQCHIADQLGVGLVAIRRGSNPLKKLIT